MSRNNTSIENNVPLPLFEVVFTRDQINLGLKFDDLTNNDEWKSCKNCNISFPDLLVDNNLCYNCRTNSQKYTAENNIDPGYIPNELQN